MKKALLLVWVGLCAAVPAFAFPPLAAINFFSERGVPFGLALDGQPLTRGAARQVHVDHLAPGAHWADFTVPTAYGGAVRFRSRVWLEPGLETSFVLIARPGRPLRLRQVGAVARYGRAYDNSYCDNGSYGYGDGRYNNRPTPYGPESYGNNAPAYNGNPSNDGYDNRPDSPGGYGDVPASGGYPGSAGSNYRVMTPQDVDALLQAVQQRPLEASKLNLAKEALSQTSIPANDLKRLLRGLGSEASRVELAKFAYPHVADQQNFYRVYEAFDLDSSVEEVQQAVGAPPQR